MSVEQIFFPSGGLKCAADLYLPEAAKSGQKVPGIVMGHSMMMVKEALGPHADYLVKAGFAVLGIDYRTIGSSEGEPRCQVFPERFVEDMRNGVSYLQTLPEIDAERIGTWGHSVGGSVAIMAGVMDRRIKCVACQNPSMFDGWAAFEKMRGAAGVNMIRQVLQQDFQQRYNTGKGMIVPAQLGGGDARIAGYAAQAAELFPSFRNELAIESTEHILMWAPIHFLDRLAPTPLLMVSGAEDTIHDIHEILNAYDKAHEPKRLEILPYDELGLSILPGLGESMNLAVEWFETHLRKAKLFEPSPGPDEAKARGLRPDYRR